MRRISVVGTSWAGKSTLARALSARLGIPHVELDAIHHQPGWQALDEGEFRRRVADVVAGERWVVDGNYTRVRDLVWERADTVVWLDLPRAVVMRQLVWRTAVRGLLRKELWNGNRERLSNFFRLDPQESVLRWSWTRHAHYRTRYEAASTDPAWARLRFVRLRSRNEVETFVRTL
jgi:adenylate kinase family enzyme